MARILVIDDNVELQGLVAKLLMGEGYDVTTATDGRAGLDLYRGLRPDLVITDIIMPDMDGVETIAELKRISPEVKIIAMSGGGVVGSGHDYLEPTEKLLHVEGTIEKPFELADMLKLVEEVLAK